MNERPELNKDKAYVISVLFQAGCIGSPAPLYGMCDTVEDGRKYGLKTRPRRHMGGFSLWS